MSQTRKQISESLIDMAKVLSDGAWHPANEMFEAGAQYFIREETDKARELGTKIILKRRVNKTLDDVSDAEKVQTGAKELSRNRLVAAVRNGDLIKEKNQYRLNPDSTLKSYLPQSHLTRFETEVRNQQHAEQLRKEREERKNKPQTEQNESSEMTIVAEKTNSDTTTSTNNAGTNSENQAGTGKTLAEQAQERAELMAARRKLFSDGKYNQEEEEYFWHHSPLKSYGRLHFHDRAANFPLEELKADFPNHKITYDETDGIYRMDGPVGQAEKLKEEVSKWCEDRDIVIANRGCKDPIRRREPKDLDPFFLEKSTLFYADLLNRVIGRYQSILDVHFHGPDKELEKQQQIYLWILNAFGMYDYDKGVPFGAFVVRQLSYWVNDLTRQTHSRTIADKENNINKAISSFQQKHQRFPNDEELAKEMGISVEKVRQSRRHIATVQSMRDQGPLETNDDSPDVQIKSDDNTEQQYIDYVEFSEKTAAILSGCENEKSPIPNILGFASLYGIAYQGESKQSLAHKMQTSTRALNIAEKDVVNRIKKHMVEDED